MILLRSIVLLTVIFLVSCGHEEGSSSSSALDSKRNNLVVISDIDDTLRLSGGKNAWAKVKTALKRKEITFWGMADLYHALKRKQKATTTYNYITAAPRTPVYNAFKVVSAGIKNDGFPIGYMVGRSMFQNDVFSYKFREHAKIIETYSGADFLLFGDDTSQDIRVFQALKQQYPDENIVEFVHHVSGAENGELPEENRFVTAADLAVKLFYQGFLSTDGAKRVLSKWEEGFHNHKKRRIRIYPDWMDCSKYSLSFSKYLDARIREDSPVISPLTLIDSLGSHCG